MASMYDGQPWDGDSSADRYQREMDNRFLQQLADGWQPMVGWRRPVDPPCPRHKYGVVDGFCGRCLQELQLAREAA